MITKDNESGRVTVEFGHGSLGVSAVEDTLLIKDLGDKGEIGIAERYLAEESDLFITFKKVESIDYVVGRLLEIKQFLQTRENS